MYATIAANISAVRERIAAAELRFGRVPGSVQLVAVSKNFPVEYIECGLQAGQWRYAENYWQEATGKITDDRLRGRGIKWHFIGPLQANKTRNVAAYFDWVHSVDDLRIAQRLSEQRPAHLPSLNVCLQVNISAEPSKAGVRPEELPALAAAIIMLPRLRLRGLMAIPAPGAEHGQERLSFRLMRDAFQGLQNQGVPLDTLSMGMSADLEAAIAEGATLVRVGTAIFGTRE